MEIVECYCGNKLGVIKGQWVNCEKCGASVTHKPLKTQEEPVADVLCNVGLSDAERDMDMLFCLAVARAFSFGSIEQIKILEEYSYVLKNREEMLDKIKGR
jgi:hypothetical protein